LRFALFGRQCAWRDRDLLAHVSTVDSARDHELLRRAVGGEPLNYLGTSYGTLLGATYANLFSNQVRAMVLDGNVDPIAWTNGGKDRTLLDTALRLRTDLGAAATLNALLDLCGQASTEDCAFSAGSPTDTHKKWKILLQRLRAQPVILNGNLITYALLVADMNAWLTTTQPEPTRDNPEFKGWNYAGDRLEQIWRLTTPGSPAAETNPRPSGTDATRRTPQRKTAETYAGPEQRYAVECAESPNPRNPLAFLELEAFSFARAGDFGPAWSWGDEPCASWPAIAAYRYTGPWDRYTANPILVVNNTLDPETPYAGAVAMAGHLARAELLTVNGYGHTALLNPSTCVGNFETRYFVDGTLPPPATVCEPDAKPFTSPVR
jgi:pimeloyl-ACP methyl ester carboxylesterase